MTPSSSVLAAFTPSGELRACINLGNPILACRDSEGGVRGVSVDLAGEFARLLGAELELVLVDAAGKSVDVVASEQADIGFFAIDPVRGANIAFSAAYVLIEGCYLVKEASPIRANEEVDRAAHRVVVGKGSAYDLFLTRSLKHAQILRAPTSPTVVDIFLEQRADVAAGVKQQLEADVRRIGGLRLLDGRFMVIQQAMGTPKSRGSEAAAFLAQFVEHMKASGFVAAALRRHGIQGASIAPAI
ncbi:ABC transporter substrate-binding protein [Massilia terrae]|uniref:ABC transporter substrate-binding protein n=1 Tax=Massilia terrae TaxID=1811224 RepID=A0ABT2CSP2_9BURK|nr:ABC transporter substrate-binding protein [Massilia terrae]MCS0656785.1 ABC transporter substrate-binding protein [Massilia terrae]